MISRVTGFSNLGFGAPSFGVPYPLVAEYILVAKSVWWPILYSGRICTVAEYLQVGAKWWRNGYVGGIVAQSDYFSNFEGDPLAPYIRSRISACARLIYNYKCNVYLIR